MDTNQLEVIGAGLFFFFIYLSGFRLRHLGKPYGSLLFNLHKLLGLAAVVFLGIVAYRYNQVSPLDPYEIIGSAITFTLFAATITTGGLLNIDRPVPPVLKVSHQFLPYITTLATAITLYLIVRID